MLRISQKEEKKGSPGIFLHAEKMVPTDIHQHLLNIYGYQTVDVSTVRRLLVHFSSAERDSEPTPLVQIYRRTACRPLFIPGKKA